MVAPWYVLADAKAEALPLYRQTLVWSGIALAVAVLAAAAVLAWARRWKKQAGDETEDTGEQLDHFRTLYLRGELSPEEFERLRGVLTQRFRRESAGNPAVGPDKPPARPTPPADGAGSGGEGG
jgi:hypothetical protein